MAYLTVIAGLVPAIQNDKRTPTSLDHRNKSGDDTAWEQWVERCLKREHFLNRTPMEQVRQ